MKFKSIYIWYTVPFLIVLIWVFAFYIPMVWKIKAKENELVILNKEMANLDAGINSILGNKSKEDKAIKTIKDFESLIPNLDKFPDFIKGIVRAAKRYNIVVTGFNSTFSTIDMTSKSVFLEPAYEINIKGRFMDVSSFIEGISNNSAYRAIRKAELSYDEKEYPVLTGKFTVEFKSWRRLPKIEGK